MANNLKDAFVSAVNKKNEARNDYEIRKQKHLEKSKALADDMVEHLSFLTDLGFKVYSHQCYDDSYSFHYAYDVVIVKPNGSHGANVHPMRDDYVASSWQLYPEGTTGTACLGQFFFKTWEDLAKAIAYTLC